MFLVEVVNPSCGLSAPGGQRLLLDSAAAVFVGLFGIDIESFVERIGHHSHPVVGVHASRVTRHFGEGGHPAGTHLLSHTQVGGNDILFLFRLYEGPQGVCRTVGIPDPVAYGALEGAVVRRVEHRLLVVRAASDLDIREHLVPFPASVLDYLRQVKVLSLLPLQILPGLFLTDEGDAIAEADRLRAGRETKGSAGTRLLGKPLLRDLAVAKQAALLRRDIELTREINLHPAAQALTARDETAVSLHSAVCGVEQHRGRLLGVLEGELVDGALVRYGQAYVDAVIGYLNIIAIRSDVLLIPADGDDRL